MFRQPRHVTGEFTINSDGMLSSPLLGRTELRPDLEQLAIKLTETLTNGGYSTTPRSP